MLALLFDPYAGASGDMIMGCLLDLGADADVVRRAVESVGCHLEISRQERGHILTTRAKVISEERFQDHDEAVSILRGSSLQGEVLEKALAALDILAEAEGRVHGVPKEEAHFHEVGALDALADIAGSCAALQSLQAESVLSLPISVGRGFIRSEHGLLPVPGPAALEILRAHDMPWRGGPVEAELLTPTGAALMAVLVDRFFLELPPIRAKRVGYGSGKRDLDLPNALRGLIAELKHEHSSDRVVQLETNVDDVTGEVLGHLIELLMDEGALDVSVLPAIMKKGRSGSVVRAIAREDESEKLSRIMIRETGSLGVRVFPSLHRYVAEREPCSVRVTINGQIHEALVKVSRLDGAIINVKPEYEDCRRIAEKTGLPLRMVIEKVEEEGWRAMEI